MRKKYKVKLAKAPFFPYYDGNTWIFAPLLKFEELSAGHDRLVWFCYEEIKENKTPLEACTIEEIKKDAAKKAFYYVVNHYENGVWDMMPDFEEDYWNKIYPKNKKTDI